MESFLALGRRRRGRHRVGRRRRAPAAGPLYLVHLSRRRRAGVADPLLRAAARRRGLRQGRAALPGAGHRARPGAPARRTSTSGSCRWSTPTAPRPARARNAAGADLNRDHIALEQPETQALHRVARRLRPHVAVDCHEFGRDSEDWRERGLAEVARHHDGRAQQPALRPRRRRRGAALGGRGRRRRGRRPGHAVPALLGRRRAAGRGAAALGARHRRRPQRARHVRRPVVHHRGGGAARAAGNRDRDLGNRVDAYLVLFRRFLAGDGHRTEDLAAIERARQRPLPAFLPTNYLWVNPDADRHASSRSSRRPRVAS